MRRLRLSRMALTEAGASSWNYLSTGATPPAGSTTWDGGSNGALEGWPGSVSPMDVATITTTTALGTKITFDLSPAVVEGWINNPGAMVVWSFPPRLVLLTAIITLLVLMPARMEQLLYVRLSKSRSSLSPVPPRFLGGWLQWALSCLGFVGGAAESNSRPIISGSLHGHGANRGHLLFTDR